MRPERGELLTGGATNPACPTGKRAYRTRAEAAQHAKRLRRTAQHMDGHVRPYTCPNPTCGLWRVGHIPAEVIRGALSADEFYDPQRRQA